MDLSAIADQLVRNLAPLTFSPPVTHIYNPLVYARKPYEIYVNRYGISQREILLFGMNPGPFGMVQTGVPFGDVVSVKEWLKIESPVGKPDKEHPKRPVTGFSCKRREISGKRLWGWIQKHFESPEKFFERFFIANYCPLVFIESSGKNKTPATLKAAERKPLLDICDDALKKTVDFFSPRFVIGIGQFAAARAKKMLYGYPLTVGQITHPSPANPRANKGWDKLVDSEFDDMGIEFR